jgi:hypothetical protein
MACQLDRIHPRHRSAVHCELFKAGGLLLLVLLSGRVHAPPAPVVDTINHVQIEVKLTLNFQ